MARFTEESLAKRDDPIYREGLTVFTPYTARSPRAPKAPAEKPQGDTDTRPAPGPRKTKTQK